MATKTFTNMKDLEKALIEEGIKKIKGVVNEFTVKWEPNNVEYREYPCYGAIVNNCDKIVDVDTEITANGAKLCLSIRGYNSFAPVYSLVDDTINHSIYESFVNDFECYCKENNIPIKRA